MSSASLSVDISAIVSRSLRGEEIDTTAAGHELAARYPDLGMSGELIGKAIARTTGMIRAAQAGESAPAEGACDVPGIPSPAEELHVDVRPLTVVSAAEAPPFGPLPPDSNRPVAPLYDAALEAVTRFARIPAGLFRRASHAE